MDITMWETLDPIALTAEQVRSAFEFRVERDSVMSPSPELFLPSARDLALRLDLDSLLTPIDATALDGFRLVRRGNSSSIISGIHRTAGKIVSNDEFSPDFDVGSALIHGFVDCIADRFRTFCQYPGFLDQSGDRAIAYSTALVRRLLQETMTAREQPRLVPRLVFPSRQALESAFADIAGQLPLTVWSAGASLVLEGGAGGYRIRQVGERGEPEGDEPAVDIQDAIQCFLRTLFRFDAIDDDGAWRFAPASLATRGSARRHSMLKVHSFPDT